MPSRYLHTEPAKSLSQNTYPNCKDAKSRPQDANLQCTIHYSRMQYCTFKGVADLMCERFKIYTLFLEYEGNLDSEFYYEWLVCRPKPIFQLAKQIFARVMSFMHIQLVYYEC